MEYRICVTFQMVTPCSDPVSRRRPPHVGNEAQEALSAPQGLPRLGLPAGNGLSTAAAPGSRLAVCRLATRAGATLQTRRLWTTTHSPPSPAAAAVLGEDGHADRRPHWQVAGGGADAVALRAQSAKGGRWRAPLCSSPPTPPHEQEVSHPAAL